MVETTKMVAEINAAIMTVVRRQTHAAKMEAALRLATARRRDSEERHKARNSTHNSP